MAGTKLRALGMLLSAPLLLTACQAPTGSIPTHTATAPQINHTAYTDALYDAVFYSQLMRAKARWCGADAATMSSLDSMSGQIRQTAMSANMPFADIDRATVTGAVASKDYDCTDTTLSSLAAQTKGVTDRMERARGGVNVERSYLRLLSISGGQVELKRGAVICRFLPQLSDYGGAIATYDRNMIGSLVARKECMVLTRPASATVTGMHAVAASVRVYWDQQNSTDAVTFVTDLRKQ